jgi:hypothetical protein
MISTEQIVQLLADETNSSVASEFHTDLTKQLMKQLKFKQVA